MEEKTSIEAINKKNYQFKLSKSLSLKTSDEVDFLDGTYFIQRIVDQQVKQKPLVFYMKGDNPHYKLEDYPILDNTKDPLVEGTFVSFLFYDQLLRKKIWTKGKLLKYVHAIHSYYQTLLIAKNTFKFTEILKDISSKQLTAKKDQVLKVKKIAIMIVLDYMKYVYIIMQIPKSILIKKRASWTSILPVNHIVYWFQ